MGNFWDFIADPIHSLTGWGPAINPWTEGIIGSDVQKTVTPLVGAYLGTGLLGPGWGTALGTGLGNLAGESAYRAAGGKNPKEDEDIYTSSLIKGGTAGLASYALAGNTAPYWYGFGGESGAQFTPSETGQAITGPETGMTLTEASGAGLTGTSPPASSVLATPNTGGTSPPTKNPMAERTLGMDRNTALMMLGGMGLNYAGSTLQANEAQKQAEAYRNAVSWTPERTSAYMGNLSNLVSGVYAGEEARRKKSVAEMLAGAGRGGGAYGGAAERLGRERRETEAKALATGALTTSQPPNYPLGAFPATSPWGETLKGAGGTMGNLATMQMMMPWLMSMYGRKA